MYLEGAFRDQEYTTGKKDYVFPTYANRLLVGAFKKINSE